MNLAELKERLAPTPVVDAPDLRVVREHPGRSGRTYLVVLVLSILFLVLFGLAVFHTVLIGAQGRLDRLDGRIADERDRQEELLLQAAELESPDRIVEEATDRLGMVPPGEVVWLTPAEPEGSVDPSPGATAPAAGPSRGSGGEVAAPGAGDGADR